MSVLFSRNTIDETEFFIKILTEYFEKIDIDVLSNGLIAKIPQIKIGNPLADIFGDMIANEGTVDYTASLPAIGVECQDDGVLKEFIGRGETVFVITQEYIDYLKSIQLRDRIKYGEFISDGQINSLQDTLNLYTQRGLPYKAIYWDNLLNQKIQISVWGNNPRVTEIIYKAVRLILTRAKLLLSKTKILNFTWSAQRGVYNYDTGRNLYGNEFDITFTNYTQTIEAPTEIIEPITDVLVYLNQKFINNINPDFNQSLNFYFVGEQNG